MPEFIIAMMSDTLDNTKSARVISYLVGRGLVDEASVMIKSRKLTELRTEIQNDIICDMVLECDEDRAREIGLRKKKDLEDLETKKRFLGSLEKLVETGNFKEAKSKLRQFLTINGVSKVSQLPKTLGTLVPKQLQPRQKGYTSTSAHSIASVNREITEGLKRVEDTERLHENLPLMSSWRDIKKR